MGWSSPRPSCVDTENRTRVVWIPGSSPGQSRACLYLADSVSCFRVCSFVFYARFYTIASVSLQVPRWGGVFVLFFLHQGAPTGRGRVILQGSRQCWPDPPVTETDDSLCFAPRAPGLPGGGPGPSPLLPTRRCSSGTEARSYSSSKWGDIA